MACGSHHWDELGGMSEVGCAAAGTESRREAAQGGGVEAKEQITPAAFCALKPAAAQARKIQAHGFPLPCICWDLGAR